MLSATVTVVMAPVASEPPGVLTLSQFADEVAVHDKALLPTFCSV